LFSGEQSLHMAFAITRFAAQVFQGQSALNDTLEKPLLSSLAVLTLSRPVSDLNGELILEFFGVFWIAGDLAAGFFSSQSEVEDHLSNKSSEPRV
jgi:hypothetical protein